MLLWVVGVVEFHRVVRMYSLSTYDYEILDDDEVRFCAEMDGVYLLYYKLKRYVNKFCKKYEKKAQTLLNSMC